MLIIRLKPTGRVNRTSYRIVVAENPSKFRLEEEKFDKWVLQGAAVSKGVTALLAKRVK